MSDVTKKQKKELLQFLEKRFQLKKGKKNLIIQKDKINIYLDNEWYNITLNRINNKIIVQILSEDISAL